MRPHRRRDPLPPGLAVLTVAVLGLAALAGVAAWTAPPVAALSDLATLEGGRVVIEGRVTESSGRALVVADDRARVLVFPPPGGTLAERGDEVRVVGVVGRAASGLAVGAESVRVLSRPADRVLTPSDLARAPTRFAGTPVALEGVLSRPPHDAWRLEDPWGGARVALDASPVPDAWASGMTARVDGVLRFQASTLAYRVTVEAWTPR